MLGFLLILVEIWSAIVMSDLLADTDYANEHYLRHLLREDRLPDFQGGKKDVMNYPEMIKGYIFYTLPKRQI